MDLTVKRNDSARIIPEWSVYDGPVRVAVVAAYEESHRISCTMIKGDKSVLSAASDLIWAEKLKASELKGGLDA